MLVKFKRKGRKPSLKNLQTWLEELQKVSKRETHLMKALMRKKKKPGPRKRNAKTNQKCVKDNKIFGFSNQERTVIEAVASTWPVISSKSDSS
jgi:hypothetical protein